MSFLRLFVVAGFDGALCQAFARAVGSCCGLAVVDGDVTHLYECKS